MLHSCKNSVYLPRILLLPVKHVPRMKRHAKRLPITGALRLTRLRIHNFPSGSVISGISGIRQKGKVSCHHSYSCYSPWRSLCAPLALRFFVTPGIEPRKRDGINTMIASKEMKDRYYVQRLTDQIFLILARESSYILVPTWWERDRGRRPLLFNCEPFSVIQHLPECTRTRRLR